MPEPLFDRFLERLADVTGIASQTELADVLGVNRSAVTQARRKNAIPSNWLLHLFRTYGLNPDWLEKGLGASFIQPVHEPSQRADAYKQIPKVKARLCAGGGSF